MPIRVVAILAVAFTGIACERRASGGGRPGDESLTLSRVTVSPADGVPADGIAQARIAVVLRSAAGEPIVGQVVELVVSGSGNALASNAPTDENGLSVAVLTSVVAETKTISAFTGALRQALAETATITFIPKPLRLVLEPHPRSVEQAGTPWQSFTVRVEDALGLLQETDSTTVIRISPLVSSGTTSRRVERGIATFADLVHERAETLSLSVDADLGHVGPVTGIGGIAVTVIAAAAAQILFANQPSDTIAGVPFLPSITLGVVDRFGNSTSLSEGSVSLAIENAPAGLSGPWVSLWASGVAAFPSLAATTAGEAWVLRAESSGLALAWSQTFQVYPANASTLVLGGLPETARAGDTLWLMAEVQDAYGNPVPSDGLALSLTVTEVNGPLIERRTLAALGSGFAEALTITRAGTIRVTVTAALLDGTLAAAAEFSILPAEPVELRFWDMPREAHAGTPFVAKLALVDAFGNVVPSGESVALGSSDTQAVLPAPGALFTEGAAAVSLLLESAGAQTVTAELRYGDLLLRGAASQLVVPDALVGLVFVRAPSSTTAGRQFSVQVAAVDRFGNVLEHQQGTLALALSVEAALLGYGSARLLVLGRAEFTGLSIAQAQPGYILTARLEDGSVPDLVPDLVSLPFDVAAGPAVGIRWADGMQPEPSYAAGELWALIAVELHDALGNLSMETEARLCIANAAGAAPECADSAGGTATFTGVRVLQAPSFVVRIEPEEGTTDPGWILERTIAIDAGDPTQLLWTNIDAVLGSGRTVAAAEILRPALDVVLADAFGNPRPDLAGSVGVTLLQHGVPTDTLRGASTVGLVAGHARFPDLAVGPAGEGFVLVAVIDLALFDVVAARSPAFVVTPGAVHDIAIVPRPWVTVGATFSLEVLVRDHAGNTIALDDFSRVSLEVQEGAPQTKDGPADWQTTLQAQAGVVRFEGLRTVRAETLRLLLRHSDDRVALLFVSLEARPDVPASLRWDVPPATTRAGQPVGGVTSPVVSLRDRFGNLVGDSPRTIELVLDASEADWNRCGVQDNLFFTGNSATTIGGRAVFSDLRLTKANRGETTYRIVATLPEQGAGVPPVVDLASVPFAVVPGDPTELFWAAPPPDSVVAADPWPTFTAQARDAYCNIVTDPLELQLTVPFADVSQVTIDGAASFGGLAEPLSWATAEPLALWVQSADLALQLPFTVDVIPGSPSEVRFVLHAGLAVHDARAGVGLSPTVQVQVRDAHENPVRERVAVALHLQHADVAEANVRREGQWEDVETNASGTASFADIAILDARADYTLSAVVDGVARIAISNTFSISAAPPQRLRYVSGQRPPPQVVASAPWSFEVEILDALGNRVDWDSATTLGLHGTFVDHTRTFMAQDGVVLFAWPEGTTTHALEDPSFRVDEDDVAQNGSLELPDPATVDIVHAEAAQLVWFESVPSALIAGAPFSVSVELEDWFGNVIAPEEHTFDLSLTGDTHQGAPARLDGPGSRNAAGHAVFAGLRIEESAESLLLHASVVTSTGTWTADSAPFRVDAGVAARLRWQVVPTTVTAGDPWDLAFVVEDAFGNLVRQDSDTTLTFLGGVLGDLMVQLDQGRGHIVGLRHDRVSDGPLRIAVRHPEPGVLALEAQIALEPAAPHHLEVTTAISTRVAGHALPTVVVTLTDRFGNPIDQAREVAHAIELSLVPGGLLHHGAANPEVAVALASTDPWTGAALFADLVIDRRGTYQLRAASTDLAIVAGLSNTFDIIPDRAARVRILTVPESPVVASETPWAPFDAELVDRLGNRVRDASGFLRVATLARADGSGLEATLAEGVATFAGIVRTEATAPEALELSLVYWMDGISDGSVEPATASVVISNAAPETLSFADDEPLTTLLAGVPFAARQVLLADRFGNPVIDQGCNVTLALRDVDDGSTQTLSDYVAPYPTSPVTGAATFGGLSIRRAGTYDLQAQCPLADGPVLTTSRTSAFAVLADGPYRLVRVGDLRPSTSAGENVTRPALVIEVHDQYDNPVAVTDTLTVTLTGTLGGVLGAQILETGARTLSLPLVDGRASLAVLSIDRVSTPASPYTLHVEADTATRPGGTRIPAILTNTFVITEGPADHLVFVSQPDMSARARDPITDAAIRIEVRDRFDNVATSYEDPVRVSLSVVRRDNPQTTPTVADELEVVSPERWPLLGVSAFDGLWVNSSGRYALEASSGDLSSREPSREFEVTAADPDHLAFVTHPRASSPAGVAISDPPAHVQVELRDAFANSITDAAHNGALVLVSRSADSPAGTLGGTRARALIAGVALFDDLWLELAGTSYRLDARASLPTGAVSTTEATRSFAFDIVAAAPDRLVVVAHPNATARAGTPIVVAPDYIRLQLFDALGNAVTDPAHDGVLITANLLGGAGDASLFGTRERAVASGVAVFGDLWVDRAGSDYTVGGAATVAGIAVATSSADRSTRFEITHASPAALRFAQEPPRATPRGDIMSPAIRVAVLDLYENPVLTGSLTVGLELTGGPATARLGNGARRTEALVSAGEAIFDDLLVDAVGTDYGFTANVAGYAFTRSSTTFTIFPRRVRSEATRPANCAALARVDLTHCETPIPEADIPGVARVIHADTTITNALARIRTLEGCLASGVCVLRQSYYVVLHDRDGSPDTVDYVDDVTLRYLDPVSADPASPKEIVLAAACHDNVRERVILQGRIVVRGVPYVTIEGFEVDADPAGSRAISFEVDGGALPGRSTVRDMAIYSSHVAGYDHGIRLYFSSWLAWHLWPAHFLIQRVGVFGPEFRGAGQPEVGIQSRYSRYVSVRDSAVCDVVFDGINLHSGFGHVVEANLVEHAGDDGIVLNSLVTSASYNRVTHTINGKALALEDDWAPPVGVGGFDYCDPSDRTRPNPAADAPPFPVVEVSGNYLHDSTGDGIYLHSSHLVPRVHGNLIARVHNATGTNGYGVYASRLLDRSDPTFACFAAVPPTFLFNTVADNWLGFKLNGVVFDEVRGNIFLDNRSYALEAAIHNDGRVGDVRTVSWNMFWNNRGTAGLEDDCIFRATGSHVCGEHIVVAPFLPVDPTAQYLLEPAQPGTGAPTPNPAIDAITDGSSLPDELDDTFSIKPNATGACSADSGAPDLGWHRTVCADR